MLQVFFIFCCVVEGFCFLLLISNCIAGHLGAHKLPCDRLLYMYLPSHRVGFLHVSSCRTLPSLGASWGALSPRSPWVLGLLSPEWDHVQCSGGVWCASVLGTEVFWCLLSCVAIAGLFVLYHRNITGCRAPLWGAHYIITHLQLWLRAGSNPTGPIWVSSANSPRRFRGAKNGTSWHIHILSVC